MKRPDFRNQKEMMMWIWNSRPHYSELTGKPLLPITHWQWHFQFLHVLNKGRYIHFKLNADNIMLGLPYEHEHQETFKKFQDKREELRAQYRELHDIKLIK